MRGRAASLALVALVLALGGGCSKSKDKAAPLPGPIPEAEATRARQACDAYVARVCACAETHPDKADECALAKSLPQALKLNLDIASSGKGLVKEDVQAVKVEARKIAANCFESDSKLDPAMCPRQ